MIIGNVDKEFLLVITKKIQSCARGFHFFQDFGNINLEKLRMLVMKTNRRLSYMIGMQLPEKIKSEKLLGMFLNMCRSK